MADETFEVESEMACSGRGAAMRCPCAVHVAIRYNRWLDWQSR